MIVTSLEAIASRFTDLPRFGAKATSCTESVTDVIVSIFVHFLHKITTKWIIDENLGG